MRPIVGCAAGLTPLDFGHGISTDCVQPTGGRTGISSVTGRRRSLVPAAGRSGVAVDREEFTSLYAASFPRLVGQLYAMTGDRAEAQDAVQEAFVRAWVHRGQIDTDRGAEAWVRVTAWRIAASRWRRAREGSRLMLLAAGPDRVAGPGPERVAFVEALRHVPAEQRRALVLYHVVD